MVVFPEFRRAATLLFAENAVEITQIIEAAAITDLCNRVCAVNQHAARITQSHVNNIICQIPTCMQFEESAEGARTHTCDIRHIRQSDLVHIVLIDIVLHFQHPSAVARHLYFRKAACGQGPCSGTKREFIENGQELHKRIKAVLNGA